MDHHTSVETQTTTVTTPEGETCHVRITPLGSGGEVGRSCVLVHLLGKTIMFDCGIHPAKSGLDSLPLFDTEDLSKVDLCLVTHFHLDHCGGLPYLCTQTSFKGRVFMTPATRKFYTLVMTDFLRVGTAGINIVSEHSVDISASRVESTDYHREIRHEGITFYTLNAGHVLGAAMFMVEVGGVRILYTGDYSRVPDRHLLGAELPHLSPDILIVESTYGIQIHETREKREEKFISWIQDIVRGGGRCLIPVFALGRAQELLLILEECWAENRDLQHIPIYYASVLAHDCIQLYRNSASAMNERVRAQLDNDVNPFEFTFIRNVGTAGDFRDTGPCVMIASPGMLQSGLSLELFERWCGRRENGCIVAGYCIDGSLAKTILSKPREVTTRDGRTLPLRMQSIQTVSFSAHSDAAQTSEFIARLSAVKHVILVHGNVDSMTKLSKKLEDDFDARGVTVQTTRNAISIDLQLPTRRHVQLLGRVATKADRDLKKFMQSLHEPVRRARSPSDSSIPPLRPSRNNLFVPIEGVLVITEDQRYCLVDPSELSTLTQLSVSRVEHATVLPFPRTVPPETIATFLHAFLKTQQVAQEPLVINTTDHGEKPTPPTWELKAPAGIRVRVQSPQLTTESTSQTATSHTTVVISWSASQQSDVIADILTGGLFQLLEHVDGAPSMGRSTNVSSTRPHSYSGLKGDEIASEILKGHGRRDIVDGEDDQLDSMDRHSRHRLFVQTLRQHYFCVRDNTETGTVVFALDEPTMGDSGKVDKACWVRVIQWLHLQAITDCTDPSTTLSLSTLPTSLTFDEVTSSSSPLLNNSLDIPGVVPFSKLPDVIQQRFKSVQRVLRLIHIAINPQLSDVTEGLVPCGC